MRRIIDEGAAGVAEWNGGVPQNGRKGEVVGGDAVGAG